MSREGKERKEETMPGESIIIVVSGGSDEQADLDATCWWAMWDFVLSMGLF
jgi:hypothetical protein